MNDIPQEQDIYRRAFNVLRDAMLVMSSYTDRNMERYLVDHGYPQHLLTNLRSNVGEWEYLRRLDYEICEIAVNQADQIVEKLPKPPRLTST